MKVKLTFTNYPNPNVLPPEKIRGPKGLTAFEFLQRASQLNPCYIFKYTQYSFGRYIITICGVEENRPVNYYWFIYINGKLSPVGADLLKPQDGDTLNFEYKLWKHGSHSTSNTSAEDHTTPIIPANHRTNTTAHHEYDSTLAVQGKGHKISAPNLKLVIAMTMAILFWNYFD